MGCCFSKKCKSRCEPEEEKVKEVLSETPSAKPRAEPKPVANVAAAEEREAEKAKKKQQATADAAVSYLGSCVSLSLTTDERSEAASESSVTTSSVAVPEWLPGKPARRRPVSADLGPAGRRDRTVAGASYGIRSRSARGLPSPSPRQVPQRVLLFAKARCALKDRQWHQRRGGSGHQE